MLNDMVNMLICPICGSLLKRKDDCAKPWQCDNQHAFGEENGIPILREITDSLPLIPEDRKSLCNTDAILSRTNFIAFVRKLIGTNYTPYPALPQSFIPADAIIMNIGSGMVERFTSKTINVDCFLFPYIDVVANSEKLPFADESVDAVVMEFCIEHIKNPTAACAEACRVLRKGGVAYISYPFSHSAHAFPNDYYRYTPEGVDALMDGMTKTSGGVLSGPACRWIGATADILTFWMPSPKLRDIARALVLGVLFPIKFFDCLFNRHPEAWTVAVTLYSVYRK